LQSFSNDSDDFLDEHVSGKIKNELKNLLASPDFKQVDDYDVMVNMLLEKIMDVAEEENGNGEEDEDDEEEEE
jgi:hypothetical protein